MFVAVCCCLFGGMSLYGLAVGLTACAASGLFDAFLMYDDFPAVV